MVSLRYVLVFAVVLSARAKQTMRKVFTSDGRIEDERNITFDPFVAALKEASSTFMGARTQSPPTICGDTVPVPGSSTPLPARGFITCCNSSHSDDDTIVGLNHFISQGGRLIDTAPDYFRETLVGQVVLNSSVDRSEFWISSKVDTDGWASWCNLAAVTLRECTVKQVEKSLNAMGLSYLDSMILHFGPAQAALQGDPFTPAQHVNMWQGLIDARNQGLVRNIGVGLTSQPEIEHLVDATGEMPALLMTWFNPWVPPAQIDFVVNWAQGKGMAVVVYGLFNFPYAGGENGAAMQQAAQDAGQRHGVTWGQLVVQWALDQNVSFVTELINQQYTAQDLPCLGFTVDQADLDLLASVDSLPCSDGPLRDGHEGQLFPGCQQDPMTSCCLAA